MGATNAYRRCIADGSVVMGVICLCLLTVCRRLQRFSREKAWMHLCRSTVDRDANDSLQLRASLEHVS